MFYFNMPRAFSAGMVVLTILLSLVGTLLLLLLIVPERRREKLGKFGRGLHDFFNMKSLIIEKILQFFYILATVFSIVLGVMLFLSALIRLFTFNDYYYQFGFRLLFIEGVILPFCFIVIGPVLIRLGYELTMMGIILVKNVIQINKKLKDQNKEEAAPAPAPKVEAVVKEPAPAEVIPDDEPTVRIPIVEEAPAPAEEAPAPAPVANKFCRNCGTPTEDGICPKCGK